MFRLGRFRITAFSLVMAVVIAVSLFLTALAYGPESDQLAYGMCLSRGRAGVVCDPGRAALSSFGPIAKKAKAQEGSE
jgi:hypothetical protein